MIELTVWDLDDPRGNFSPKVTEEALDAVIKDFEKMKADGCLPPVQHGFSGTTETPPKLGRVTALRREGLRLIATCDLDSGAAMLLSSEVNRLDGVSIDWPEDWP